ncbi:MAG: fructan beta-fructosidase [Chthoniobacter sp.]|jgi:sucrose-6-phosphate hydrolase SacC (GH32 family)|nr:fructan beta-fructosidase [Chthoniobacter sp.]
MKSASSTILLAVVLLNSSALRAAESDLLIGDFEGRDFGAWTVEGTAFGTGPAQGTLPGQMPVEGFLGKGLANSFVGRDNAKGKLTSPEFKIERKFIAFLIGGGGFAEKTCLNLLVGGKVVRTATGPNLKPGGSEALEPQRWEVSEYAGRTARIEIVDDATGGWGHINVDHIVQTDRAPARLLSDVAREITLDQPLLNLPVKTGAPKRHLRLIVDGETVRELVIELADAEPEFWVFAEVAPWRGKTATLIVDKLPEDSLALKSVETGATIKGAENLYAEPLRPQFHFSTRRGWINDPNGMAFYRGEYHLFYQLSPYTWGGAAKFWGHAVSRDLLHWEELPFALYPDALGQMYSGSGVVDWKNSSGFGSNGEPPLVLIYTAAGNPTTQCLASSTDGRTVTKFSGNPVLPQVTGGNRDPKVIWHEPTQRWVMALYVGHGIPPGPDGKSGRRDTIQFFASPNLKEWTPLSEIDGYYECPDIFELPLDGDSSKKKWVLTAASSDYQIGHFDGKTFLPETPKLRGQRGNGMYAAQTFSDLPDGRRVQIGWGTSPAPGMPFNQQMTFPCELTLRSTAEGPRLFWQPVKELEKLRAKTHSIPPGPLQPGDNPLANIRGEFFEILADLEPGDAAQLGFKIRGLEVLYDAKQQELSCRGKSTPLALQAGRVRLQILVDRLSAEIFGNDGLVYMPCTMLPAGDDPPPAIFAKGGAAKIHALEVHELRSIWPAAAKPDL